MTQTNLFDFSDTINPLSAGRDGKQYPHNPKECINNLHCRECGWYPTFYAEWRGCAMFWEFTGSNKELFGKNGKVTT